MFDVPPQYPPAASAKVDIQVWRDLAQGGGAKLARIITGGYVVSDAAAPPIITVLGENPMTVSQGSVYTDPGAMATNIYGDELTPAIVTSGSVNTATPGTYSIKYTVTDTAGISTSTTRTVIVTGQQSTPTPTLTPTTPTPTPTTPGALPTSPTPPADAGQPPAQPSSPSPSPVGTNPGSGNTGYFEPVIPFNPNGPTHFGSGSNGSSGGSDNSSDLLGGSGHIGSNGSTLGYALAVMVNGIDTPRSATAGAVDAGLGWSQHQLDESARSYKKARSRSVSKTTQEAPTQSLLVATVLGLAASVAVVALVPLHFVVEYPVVFYPLSGGLLGYLLFYLYGMFIAGKTLAKPMDTAPRDTFS